MSASKSSLSSKFSQKPSTSSMDNSKRIDDSIENYSLFEVNYDGMFDEQPLRNSLESGLTIIECDNDVKKMYDTDELYSRKLALMTFDESRSWEKEQSISKLLRTPPLKKRRKGFDCIEEPVGCDDGSLPGKIKDEFSNEVILDDVVSSPATLSMLLKRKGKSRVKFTRMRGIIKRSKWLT
ncbi:hypothetical protein Tco_0940624 [Tanacetum coccineum]|uniref:Uncharacterized protein n=1 Tax=Tanacetum coccineum TaxID=301880 RepID=A0ABQ5DP15_9ASTR